MLLTSLTSLVAIAPPTLEWSPKVAFVMIVCNVLAIALAKFTMKHPSTGPALPAPQLFGGMGFPALVATTSFGHVLGLGTILGLTSLGYL